MRKPAAPAPEPPPTPPSTRVEIVAAARQVVVEAADPLNTVARKALDLWKATDTPAAGRGDGEAVGFVAEAATPSTLMPPETQLPHRLLLEGAVEDRRRSR